MAHSHTRQSATLPNPAAPLVEPATKVTRASRGGRFRGSGRGCVMATPRPRRPLRHPAGHRLYRLRVTSDLDAWWREGELLADSTVDGFTEEVRVADVAGVLLDHVLKDEPDIGVAEFRVRHEACRIVGHPCEHLPRLLARLQIVLVDVPGRM